MCNYRYKFVHFYYNTCYICFKKGSRGIMQHFQNQAQHFKNQVEIHKVMAGESIRAFVGHYQVSASNSLICFLYFI